MSRTIETIRAYKTELNPNNRQATRFEQFAEARRFVFNVALREWQRQYENGGKPSEYGLRKQFNAIKYDYAEHCKHFQNVLNAPYAVTEAAFSDLSEAFQHFFRRVKNGDEKLGYPKFKHQANSFAVRNTKVKDNQVRITGVGWVRLKECDYIPTTDSGVKFGTYATVSRCAGRWFISMPVHEEVEVPDNGYSDVLGVDLGLHHLIMCSDGTMFDRSHALEEAERKVRILQKELDRRKEGGKNWRRTKHKLQNAYYRVSTARKDWLHRVSNYLTEKCHPSVIALEDLNVKGMANNSHLAKALSDACFGELRRQIEYKAERNGIEIVIIDRWFPSSKTCSRCSCIKDDLALSDRIYECDDCGLVIDRDWNAALNLAAKAKAQTESDCVGS